MQVLIAPNAFKHALDARTAALAIEEGVRQAGVSCGTTVFPVGDGGDGTGRLLTEHCNGTFIQTKTIDPLGRKIEAVYGLIGNGRTAVVEMATASGLHLLRADERNPLIATTEGTGLQIRHALDQVVKTIVLCVGGSATVDGGVGILRALGARFLDKDGQELGGLPASLRSLATIDDSNIDPRILATEIIVLCDVKNKLLGDQGAAAIFGPQKGASAADVAILEQGLSWLSEHIAKEKNINIQDIIHGGAAGGTAAGLYGLLNAKLVNGIDHFLDVTGFDNALTRADIVITGEGSIDLQTLDGKAPYGVAFRAKQKRIPVIALGGNIDTPNKKRLLAVFDEVININPQPTDLATALKATGVNLVRTSKELALRMRWS